MIQIDDFDTPIQVAEKIIRGTKKKAPASMLDKAVYKAFMGKELGDTKYIDMFKLIELKEIAEHLLVYYENNTE